MPLSAGIVAVRGALKTMASDSRVPLDLDFARLHVRSHSYMPL
jgi:hypothetical protein